MTKSSLPTKLRKHIIPVVPVVLFPVVPAIIFWFWPPDNLDIRWDGLSLVISVCFALATIVVALVYLRKNHPEEWGELRGEASFILWQCRYSSIIAGALGLLAVSMYLMLPLDAQKGSIPERVAAAFPIYFAVVAAVLGIHAFHRRSAPITSVNRLLEYLCKDLKDFAVHNGNESRLLIVFPAPNIGLYRSLKHDKNVKEVSELSPEHPYRKFKSLFLAAAERLKSQARIVSYPATLFSPLYESYDAAKAGNDPERAKICALDAESFCTIFCVNTRDSLAHVEVDPSYFPSHVIVVGPVVYLISSYGLPKYKEKKKEPIVNNFVGSEKDLARLLVYRREDDSLASLVIKEVDEQLEALQGNQRNPRAGAVQLQGKRVDHEEIVDEYAT